VYYKPVSLKRLIRYMCECVCVGVLYACDVEKDHQVYVCAGVHVWVCVV